MVEKSEDAQVTGFGERKEAEVAQTIQEIDWVEEGDGGTVPKPKCGGLFKSDKGEVVPFVGTNPDAKINSYSWCDIKSKWSIDAKISHSDWDNIKGPVNVGQYRPRGVKSELKTQEACIRYDGTKFDGVVSKDGAMSVTTYKELVRSHCIKNGMFNVFEIEDPRNPSVVWDAFRHQSKFPLQYVKEYIEKFKRSEACDQYARQNLEFSGDFIRNTLTADFLTKVLKEVDLNASGPETFVGALLVVHSDSYEALETCKSKLKGLTLKDYPGEYVADCCVDIKTYSERLDSAGSFEPELL